MSARGPMTVVEVAVTVQAGEQLFTTRIAAAFDPVRSLDAARGAGRAIGEQVGDCLALRLQRGERLT